MTDGSRHTTVIGVDPGERRYGIAVADLETRFARPLEVIDATTTEPAQRVAELAREHNAVRIVIGKPIGLSGAEGPAVAARASFAQALRNLGLTIVEYDERLTTVIAEQGLRAAGASRRARSAQRDAVAAQVLLQSFLDSGA